MREPLVYIVLVNWNGLEDTLECLRSLNEISYKNYKIVVVDNGSNNNQANVIKKKFPYIELIKNKRNEGFVVANNQGIELALKNGADYILLLNNDTVVEQNFLNILINHAERNRDVGILSPKILYFNSNEIWSMGCKISYLTGFSIKIGKGKNSENYNEVIKPDFVSGCAMLIKKEVVEEIGSLDPIYFAYYEDVDYCFRAKRASYKVTLIPETVIWHKKYPAKFEKLNPTKSYLLARNAIIFGMKNLSGLKRISYLLAQFIFRAPFNLIFLMQNFNAFKKYLIGIYHGVLTKIQSSNNNYIFKI